MDRAGRRRARQRARLLAAEAATFAHYGIEATSEPLLLRDLALHDPARDERARDDPARDERARDDPARDGAFTTRVVRIGSGAPTVLLHGSTLTATVWAPLVAHLPDRALYLVDLPGCGLADPFDHRGVDLAAHQSAFVRAVLAALGLERAALLGASMGGWYALRAAITRPHQVVAAALVTAPALALPGARVPVPMALSSTWAGRRLADLVPPPSARATRRMLATVGGDASVADAPEVLFDALGAATALGLPSTTTFDLARWRTPHTRVQVQAAELAGCPTPVLFVWGDRDRVQPPSAGALAAARLPRGRIEVLEGGHGLFLEQPERCGYLVSAFLREVEREERRTDADGAGLEDGDPGPG